MKDQFSLLRYAIELTFLRKLAECKWWQFGKRKRIYQWRNEQLKRS